MSVVGAGYGFMYPGLLRSLFIRRIYKRECSSWRTKGPRKCEWSQNGKTRLKSFWHLRVRNDFRRGLWNACVTICHSNFCSGNYEPPRGFGVPASCWAAEWCVLIGGRTHMTIKARPLLEKRWTSVAPLWPCCNYHQLNEISKMITWECTCMTSFSVFTNFAGGHLECEVIHVVKYNTI